MRSVQPPPDEPGAARAEVTADPSPDGPDDRAVTLASISRCAQPARTHVHGDLQRAHEQGLFERAGGGDRCARDELAARFMPLARSLAVRYRSSPEPLDDLMQVAAVGLIKAIDRYDPSRGVAFSTYAVPTIAGELKRYFRDYSWSVRPPRGLRDLAIRADRLTEDLTRRLHRAPTTAELSAAVGCDEEALLEAIQANGARRTASLHAPTGSDGTATLEDSIGHDDGGIESAETHAVLDDLFTILSVRERSILRMRIDEDLRQREIGAIIGVSQMQVSRIIRHALQRLRDAADGQSRPAAAVHAAADAAAPV